MFDFRLPHITGATPHEQMAQMQSYIQQFVEQLQWALSSMGAVTGSDSQIAPKKEEPTVTAAHPYDAATAWIALKPLIIKSPDIFNAYYDKMIAKLGDVVIETGAYETETGCTWHYKKWLSGTYQMFGAFTITPTETVQSPGGVLYQTNDIVIEAPFPITTAFAAGTSTEYCFLTNSGITEDHKKITFRIASDKAISPTDTLEVHLSVSGQYELPTSDESSETDGSDTSEKEET